MDERKGLTMGGIQWTGAIVISLILHVVIIGLFLFPSGTRSASAEAANESNVREDASVVLPTNTPPATAAAPTGTSATPVTPSPTVATTPDTPAAIPEFYVVKAGDTLTKIAKIYGTTPEKIAQANDKPMNKMNLIWVGQKIRLR